MNWDAIGAIAESFGAIGVVLTLLYLAIQTKLNTQLLEQTLRTNEANGYRANIEGVIGLQQVLAQDESLALTWKKGLRNEPITEGEHARFESYLSMVLYDLEYKVFVSEAAETENFTRDGILEHVQSQVAYLFQSQYVRDWCSENADRFFGPSLTSILKRAGATNGSPRVA